MPLYAVILITSFLAYLLGSIPFGYVLVRLLRGSDVRQTGSGNIGATNVARMSPRLGLITLILDASKGFAAVWLAMQLYFPLRYKAAFALIGFSGAPLRNVAIRDFSINGTIAFAMICVVLGHIFPVWLRFRGGKGVATGVGAFLPVVPKAVALVVLLFCAIVLASRYVSLGSMIAAATLPLTVWIVYPYAARIIVISCAAVAALIIIKHRSNISRLLAGTERRFSLRRG